MKDHYEEDRRTPRQRPFNFYVETRNIFLLDKGMRSSRNNKIIYDIVENLQTLWTKTFTTDR